MVQKAAAKNDEKALYNLGLCFKYGEGVVRSDRWAKYYFSEASKFDHPKANAQLKSIVKATALSNRTENQKLRSKDKKAKS